MRAVSPNLLRGSVRCVLVGAATSLRRSRSGGSAGLVARGAALGAASAGVVASSPALLVARRGYFWPYPENLVPEGASTSSFQSSPVPSVRDRIVREYALSPLFGQRTPCCVLGFADAARDVVGRKAALRYHVAAALGRAEADVELGPLVQTKEMLLHRSGTDESPRLTDGAAGSPAAMQRRVTRYARLPVRARTLLEVYLPGEAGEAGDDAEADVEAAVLAHGLYLQDLLHRCMSTAATAGVEGERPSRADAAGTDDDGEASAQASVAALHEELGVVYCEVPALDVSDSVFGRLNGQDVDAATAERVMERWSRRIAQQEEQRQQRPPPHQHPSA